MKRLLAFLLLLPGAALAEPRVDLQQFKPAPGYEDLLAVQSGQLPDPKLWNFFLALHYADQPFRLIDRASGNVAGTIIGHQTSFDVGASYTLDPRFEIGVVVPVTVNQSAGGAAGLDPSISGKLAASGLGDLRILPKALFLSRNRWDLAAAMPLTLPTGTQGFLGHGGITARPRVIGDFDSWRGMRFVGDLGLAVRSSERYLNFDQAIALDYGAGGEVPFHVFSQDGSALLTLGGEMGLKQSQVEERPLELLGGVRWKSPKGLVITAGGGPGLTRGAGTPDYRLFLTIGQTVPPFKQVAPVEPQPELVQINREQMRLDIIEPVYFGTDNDLIEPRSYPVLERVADVLVANPWIRKVRIEGHTDNQGGESYNLNLSQLRAISVAKFLVEHGVEPDVVEAKGFGLSKPVDTNDTPEGRAKNRRVEFVILAVDPESAPQWAKDKIQAGERLDVPVPGATPAPPKTP